MDPSYSQAHRVLGLVLVAMDRHDEAREAMRRARELDPYYPMQPAVSAYERLMARDYSSALEFAQQATTVGPSFWIGYYQLAAVHERLGTSDAALKALEKAAAWTATARNSRYADTSWRNRGAGVRPRTCCATLESTDGEGTCHLMQSRL